MYVAMALQSRPSLFTYTLFLSLLSYSTSVLEPHHHNSSAFEFLEHLKGCHKGDNVKGIHDLKTYLEKFGYLSYGSLLHAHDDDFDVLLESAVKTYQLNYHIKPTGTLDGKTVAKMMTSRCGVADIINGTNPMQSGNKKHHHGHHHGGGRDNGHSISNGIVSHYAFFRGKHKWPASKYHLSYGFDPSTPPEAMNAVKRAFQTWAHNTHFRFRHMAQKNHKRADIRISFEHGDHGDGTPFDGAGGVLAHAFPPTHGSFHYDADEQWSVGALRGYYDLETVALHEIGHLLGLAHSSVEGAIMYPYIASGVANHALHRDDIQGIKALYNA